MTPELCKVCVVAYSKGIATDQGELGDQVDGDRMGDVVPLEHIPS